MEKELLRLFDIIGNIFKKKDINYVVENADWVIKKEGENIIERLTRWSGRVTTTDFGICGNCIVHYGSLHLFISKTKFPKNAKCIIATCYHIVDGDERVDRIPFVDQYIGKWHTSCNITKEKLIKYGVPEKKIKVIPIGVDTAKFFPVDEIEKNKLKLKLGIPNNVVIVGSFQKDGNGWGEGKEPKLIKGPDVFCDVLERLSKKKDIFVILSGPARGYVKDRLEKAGIRYKHFIFDDPDNVAELYRVLDLYIVASREEGGPKAILESMASGVPIITTKVGMAPDIVVNEENGMLCEICDVDALTDKADRVMSDKILRNRIIHGGHETSKKYDIKKIVQMYEMVLYK